MTHFPNMLKQDLKVKGVDLSKASTNKCVCVFWPPVEGELLLSMRYQSLVLTSVTSPPCPSAVLLFVVTGRICVTKLVFFV